MNGGGKVVVLLAWFVGATALAWMLVRDAVRPYGPWVALGVKGLLSAGTGAILCWLLYRERPIAALGLGAPVARGVPRALLVVGLYLAAVMLLGHLTGEPANLALPPAMLLATTLFNSIVEEAAFRGVLVLHLARHMRFWIANLVGAAAFVAVHLPTFVKVAPPPAVVIMSASLFVLALVLGDATRATRSIWIAVLAHTVNNLIASQ